MSTSAYDMPTSDPTESPRPARKRTSSGAPNNSGLVLLVVALLLVIGLAAFVGVPALDELRGHADCVSVTDGTSADVAADCRP